MKKYISQTIRSDKSKVVYNILETIKKKCSNKNTKLGKLATEIKIRVGTTKYQINYIIYSIWAKRIYEHMNDSVKSTLPYNSPLTDRRIGIRKDDLKYLISCLSMLKESLNRITSTEKSFIKAKEKNIKLFTDSIKAIQKYLSLMSV